MAQRKRRTERYGPATRLLEVRNLLNSAEGASLYDIAERFGVSVMTASRYLEALSASGEPLEEDWVGKRKVWRLMPSARRQSIAFTTTQMLSLLLSRRVFDFLAGTGFKEDLDEVFAKVESMMQRRDFLAVRNFDRKIYDVNEAPHIYKDRIEHVNDIVTALLREQRLFVVHESVSRGRRAFLLDPYSLLVYRKGLYLAGFSHEHEAVRTFALDGFRDVTWRKGDSFDYPKDFHPSQLADGAFGLFRGPATRVRIFFTSKVARYVERRRWHPTQEIRKVPGGIELSMTTAGTTEVVSFALGFGAESKVLEPADLRIQMTEEAARLAAAYRDDDGHPPQG